MCETWIVHPNPRRDEQVDPAKSREAQHQHCLCHPPDSGTHRARGLALAFTCSSLCGDSVMQKNGFGVGAHPAKLSKHSPRTEEHGARPGHSKNSPGPAAHSLASFGTARSQASGQAQAARHHARLAGTECTVLPKPPGLCWGLAHQCPW